MLHFCRLQTPTNIFVHGFITVNGREDVQVAAAPCISPRALPRARARPGVAALLLRRQAQADVEDIDFKPDDFVARVNSDLVGKYVNIASRAAPFITRHFDGGSPRRPNRLPRVPSVSPPRTLPRPRRHGPITMRANSARPCATSCASPTASTKTSTRRKPWVAGEGPRATRSPAVALLAGAARHSSRSRVARAGPARRGVSARPRVVRSRTRFHLGRRLAGARADQALPASDDARRSKADRRAARRTGQPAARSACRQRHEEHQQHAARRGEHRSIDEFNKIDLRVARIVERRAGRRRGQAGQAHARHRRRDAHRVRRHQVRLCPGEPQGSATP